MNPKNVLSIRSRDEFRQWLSANHRTKAECWATVKRGMSTDASNILKYIDAVEEALCFGWIDTTTKTFEDGITYQRFTPRRKGSAWSELNKERCRRMERLGLMTEAGRAVLPDMSEEGFKIMPEIIDALKADAEAWSNFQQLPSLYKRVRIDTIQIKHKQKDLFNSRLEKFIENTRRGIMYGQWNDGGRLCPESDNKLS